MLKVNIGLSRKVSRDYNSTGFSVNLEGEVCAPLDDPEMVVEKIKELYDLAEESLNQQLERYEGESAIASRDAEPSRPAPPPSQRSNGNSRSTQNGPQSLIAIYYILGQTGRFKAAVSGAGSGLYAANYGHDMYQRWYIQEFGLPWENRELWEKYAPFNHIHKATTPTLFVCGEKDWNVPVQNSEQLYQVLNQIGVPTRLVVYPGEHHGGWSFAHNKDYAQRRLAWFDKYLKAKPE